MLCAQIDHNDPAGRMNLVNFVNIDKPTRESGPVPLVRELLIEFSVKKPASIGPSTAHFRSLSVCGECGSDCGSSTIWARHQIQLGVNWGLNLEKT
jgi:hypothetical protein